MNLACRSRDNCKCSTNIIGERCSVHHPHVDGTRPGPVPTKPAGKMADESAENVHRFARKSPDTPRTRPGPVPTKPAGKMADESAENVHRFARKSPDTPLRLACDKYSCGLAGPKR